MASNKTPRGALVFLQVLCNDESVYHYENIMGVQSNIHFISHSHFEDNEREHDSRNHKNSHEALFLYWPLTSNQFGFGDYS
jgi:hypothetical protein